MFLNYAESIQKVAGQDEFNLRFFRTKSETLQNKKFYTKFFGNHSTNVQNQLFTNFISQVTDQKDERSMLKKNHFD